MDKKTLLLAVITGMVFVLWMNVAPYIERELGWNPPPPEKNVIETTETSEESDPVEKTGEAKSLDDGPLPADPEKTSEKVTEVKDKVAEKTEDIIKSLPPENLTTPEFTMTVDPQKGIGKIKLTEHKETMDEDSPRVVVGDDQFYSLNLTGSADNWKFGTAQVTKSENKITIRKPVIGQNFSVEQTIELSKDFQFKKTFRIINEGKTPLKIDNLGVNAGQMKPIALGEVGMMAGMDQGVDVFLKEDEDIETYFFQDILEEAQELETSKNLKPGLGSYFLEDQGLQWIAVKNRYFAWIVDYEPGFAKCEVAYNPKSIILDGKPETVNYATANGYFKPFEVQPGATHEIELNCFAGPQQYSILDNLNHDKKEIMQLNLFMWMKVGWIGAISEWLLIALIFFHSLVGSYGLAIIMLTIIVKALFWRITNKSTESMKKMSALSPKIKELNEKYADNPQVKQQEIMKLYREAGVNPIAGCLPLLLQMPVFIALFNALRGAIELRHSEFLWIADLSQPDTVASIFGLDIRPLAIAWAASMFLQQRIVPSAADETQKRIMMIMPVVMLFVCYGMPSGLTLYWTFSTLMSILQYYLNNKKASGIETQTAAKAATG